MGFRPPKAATVPWRGTSGWLVRTPVRLEAKLLGLVGLGARQRGGSNGKGGQGGDDDRRGDRLEDREGSGGDPTAGRDGRDHILDARRQLQPGAATRGRVRQGARQPPAAEDRAVRRGN